MSASPSPTTRSVLVWDLPLRLFHWCFAALIIANIVIAEFSDALKMDDPLTWHARLGYAILALLVFRLLWGFVGGTHARFASFVRGPGAILAYLKGQGAGSPGHNPLGALSVLALLASCIVQAVTGLFLTDEVLFEAPLFKLVDGDTAMLMAQLHDWNSKLLIVLILLHLAALLFYRVVKGERLVSAMLSGRKQVPADASGTDAQGGSLLVGAALAALAGIAVWYLVTQV
ncbi:MAG: cytochrome b/b6 domain-containing protein [Moraxellaceae bacterium]|nr:cytochrome b/b6 domain-containing protein [Moraxellaceae bacterium]